MWWRTTAARTRGDNERRASRTATEAELDSSCTAISVTAGPNRTNRRSRRTSRNASRLDRQEPATQRCRLKQRRPMTERELEGRLDEILRLRVIERDRSRSGEQDGPLALERLAERLHHLGVGRIGRIRGQRAIGGTHEERAWQGRRIDHTLQRPRPLETGDRRPIRRRYQSGWW